MLMNQNWNESREKRIVLGETPSCEAVFEDFLKYLYTGKIALDFATVIPIVSLADKYNVTDLLTIGTTFIARWPLWPIFFLLNHSLTHFSQQA